MSADKAFCEKFTYIAELKKLIKLTDKTKENIKMTLSKNHLENKPML